MDQLDILLWGFHTLGHELMFLIKITKIIRCQEDWISATWPKII